MNASFGADQVEPPSSTDSLFGMRYRRLHTTGVGVSFQAQGDPQAQRNCVHWTHWTGAGNGTHKLPAFWVPHWKSRAHKLPNSRANDNN